MNPDHFALTASDRALLAAALSSDADKAADAWRAWRGAADLDALPDGHYLMLAALYANLARFGLADEADPRIKGVYRRAWYANRRLVELAAAALAALGGAGIPAALGGGAAVQDLYAGPGARPIGQIELLVAPADVTGAAATLGRVGWQPARPPELLADPEYRRWVHQAMFRRDRAEVQRLADVELLLRDVELLALAWRPLPAAPAPGDAARFTARALDADAAPPRLRREAQLIIAAARAAEGGPGRLIALADACMLLRTPLDWELVAELAELLAAAQVLAAALAWADEVLGGEGAGRLQVAATFAKSHRDASRSADADSLDAQPAQAGFAEVAAVSNRRMATVAKSHRDASRSADADSLDAQPAQAGFAEVAAVANRRAVSAVANRRKLPGRIRFHLRRWRRIARGQGVALTPFSLLRYLRAAAGVTRTHQLLQRLLRIALRAPTKLLARAAKSV